MCFRKQFQYVAIGCFCTLAGMLFSSSVLPLFGGSGETIVYDTVFCKALTVFGEDSKPIAILGNSRTLLGGNEERGTLLLSHKDTDLQENSILTNSSLSFNTIEERVIELSITKNSGRLLLNSSKNDGVAVIGEKDESGFTLGIFGSKGIDNGAGASLSVEGDKGQLVLFGENSDLLFGRGKIHYGQ